MSKPQVFISHSCKDAEIDDGVTLDEETDPRKRRLKFARAVRDAVVAGLATGCEPLLDRALLDPGDDWRMKLLRWLGSCQGAVLLLSEDSVHSRWVLQEATIAAWRKWLRADFVLVPVFVGVVDEALLESAGFGPLQITAFQAARFDSHAGLDSAAAVELARRVVDCFATLLADPASTNEMQDWVDNVAALLRRVDEKILMKTRRPLRISEADWAHFPDRETTVAHGLLHAGIDAAARALVELKRSMDEGAFQRLAMLLLPTWVDAEAASVLAAGRAGGPRWFALNAEDPQVAHDYAERAFCCPGWWAKRCVDFDEAVGEGQAHEAMTRLLHVVETQWKVKGGSKVLEGLLKRYPFFVVFRSDGGPLKDLCALVAASPALSTMIGLRMAGAAFECLADEDSATFTRLLPALDDSGIECAVSRSAIVMLVST